VTLEITRSLRGLSDDRRPPCAEEYIPFVFSSQDEYNELVRINLARMGYLQSVDANPSEVTAALSRWYFAAPSRPFGIACSAADGHVVVNSRMLTAIAEESGPSQAAASSGGPRAETHALTAALVVGGVLAVGTLAYLLWRS